MPFERKNVPRPQVWNQALPLKCLPPAPEGLGAHLCQTGPFLLRRVFHPVNIELPDPVRGNLALGSQIQRWLMVVVTFQQHLSREHLLTAYHGLDHFLTLRFVQTGNGGKMHLYPFIHNRMHKSGIGDDNLFVINTLLKVIIDPFTLHQAGDEAVVAFIVLADIIVGVVLAGQS